MKVKLKETEKKFKPFKIEIEFEEENELYDLQRLLMATNYEIEYSCMSSNEPVYPSLNKLRELLNKQIK